MGMRRVDCMGCQDWNRFLIGATVMRRAYPTLQLRWLTDKPVWVDQWPLNHEKLVALLSLVEERLAQGHIEYSTSPWNKPVFVIKKKSGK